MGTTVGLLVALVRSRFKRAAEKAQQAALAQGIQRIPKSNLKRTIESNYQRSTEKR